MSVMPGSASASSGSSAQGIVSANAPTTCDQFAQAFQETDRYDNPPQWRTEYDWDLGTPLGALTASDGSYSIAVPSGTYTIRVTRIGFAPDSMDAGVRVT
mgnify:CR=1 FL=1